MIIKDNLEGEGQEGGASLIMLLVILVAMVNTSNVFTTGTIEWDPVTTKKNMISVLSYVDDNSIFIKIIGRKCINQTII